MRQTRLIVLAAVVVAIAATAAGCGGGSSSPATPVPTPGQSKASVFNDPALFVLDETDLPDGYVVDVPNTRPITNADTAKGHDSAYLRNIESMGRISGYASGWHLTDAKVVGPIQIESRASTYETVGGAEDAYAQLLTEIGPKYKPVDATETIGDESRTWTQPLDSANGPLTVYTIAWRYGQVVAALSTASQGGTGSADDALAYAQKQETRIETTAAKAPGK
jgi:hypothetical protein